ncbi:hypothetical protein FGA82_23250 [Pseudomonas fluorescens]|nr:hypothetical protein FGA82_23250 [Pseudomonas fluorescens]
MWERACSRMQGVSQQICRLALCLREQARSHRFLRCCDNRVFTGRRNPANAMHARRQTSRPSP